MIKREVEIRTRLSTEEIVSKLHTITERYFTGASEHTNFEGKIEPAGFRILPTFNFGNRGQLRPELIGLISNEGRLSTIKITIQLPKFIRNLMLFALFFNLIILLTMILFPRLVDHPFWSKWGILIFGIILTFFSLFLSYNYKVKKSLKLLKLLLYAD